MADVNKVWQIISDHYQYADERNWIGIHSPRFYEVDRDYTKALEWLEDRGYIEINHAYWAGSSEKAPFTKHYRVLKFYETPEQANYRGFKRQVINILNRTTLELPSDYQRPELTDGQHKYWDSVMTVWNSTIRGGVTYKLTTDNNTGKKCHQGRLYTAFCTLPRVLRPFARLDGRELVEIDLKAAQPWLIAHMSEDDQLMADVLADKYYKTIHVDRSKAKGLHGKVWYESKKDDPGYRRIKKRISEAYPKAWAYRQQCRRSNQMGLCARMNKMESDLVIRQILKPLLDDGVPALSVHDAIYTFPEYAKGVADLMVDLSEKMFYKSMNVCLDGELYGKTTNSNGRADVPHQEISKGRGQAMSMGRK